MSPLTIKAQSLKFDSKTPLSTARRPKKPRKAQKGHLEEGKSKSSEEQEKLKINRKTQNQHSP
jgi:hypothetical protein